MTDTKICLCLTATTLRKNLEILNEYRKWIDIAELRADYLTPDEALNIRKFPELAKIPTILTVRRTSDGGTFSGGESGRTTIFARGLSFADQNASNNFAYIDLEEDYNVPSLQDAALAFGIKVIRSYHNMEDSNFDFQEKMLKLKKTGFEIPKVACMANSLSDVTKIFNELKGVDYEHIVCAMGNYGVSTRILAKQLGSHLTYCSPPNTDMMTNIIGHIDPIMLNDLYGFRTMNAKTQIFGVAGYPLAKTDSPKIHGKGYRDHGLNAVYVPIKTKSIDEVFDFADACGAKGFSVTVPHKETVIPLVDKVSKEVDAIGACNTIFKSKSGWKGYNTDAEGFKRALVEFLGIKSLKGKKVALIGAGGSAKAVAYALNELKANVCIFNRTIIKARNIAEPYGFKYAGLGLAVHDLIDEYSWLIIQTTPIGMGFVKDDPTESGDPLEFYNFRGDEQVYDIIYYPEKTPILERAEKAGCKICNGYNMLHYQAYEQFEIFTGVKYE